MRLNQRPFAEDKSCNSLGKVFIFNLRLFPMGKKEPELNNMGCLPFVSKRNLAAMKKSVVFILAVLFSFGSMHAQSQRGFDYKAHASMNKKAAKWGKRRTKAAKGDITNIKCSVRTTRRATRKSQG